MSYPKSVLTWMRAGRPKRTNEQVAELFAICEGCEYFRRKDEGKGNCGLCGCRLTLGGSAMANKLQMATEHCPVGKW